MTSTPEPADGTVIRITENDGRVLYYVREDYPASDTDPESRWWSLVETGLAITWGDLASSQPVPLLPATPEPGHTLIVRAGSWALDHPETCTDAYEGCPVNWAVAETFGTPASRTIVDGRYQVDVNDLGDRLLIGDRVDLEQAPVVRVGQVWADNDVRSTGRQIRVVEVDATHATVELVDQRGRPARGHEDAQKAEPGRQTRIRLDRFRPTSTGYTLLQGAPTGEQA